jgi:hypothetical protein
MPVQILGYIITILKFWLKYYVKVGIAVRNQAPCLLGDFSTGAGFDLHVAGCMVNYDFHGLEGKPKRYRIHVNGPWCITFEWVEGGAWRVDLEQYQ